ncbi:hypothetical protein DOS48_06570 [Halorubrum sp. PV6]|nr:hypothetical protein DOS48_06570 [Halorubrum sp. PV6]
MEGQTSPRLVGRCFIPTHELSDGECYANDGWFGAQSGMERDELQRPESIWGDAASDLADNLEMGRPDSYGTTIMIPGFRDPADPAMDDQPSPQELCREFEKSTADYFWPAIRAGDLEVDINMCGHSSRLTKDTIKDHERIAPFVTCYDQIREAPESFKGPGTVAKTNEEYSIVSKKEDECEENEEYPTPSDGHVTVAARKANPSDTEGPASKRIGEIAMFRGPGMVVKYKSGHYLGHSGKYHALLAAGKARTLPGESHDSTDEAIDDFLAMAEPPMHDRWYGEKNDELSAKYEYGAKGPADDISTKILRNGLSKILYNQSRQGGSLTRPGRDILPKTRSDLAKDGGTNPPTPTIPPLFDWDIKDEIVGNSWNFTGSIGPNTERKQIAGNPIDGWETTFEIVALFEDNREADTVVIEDVDAEVESGSGSTTTETLEHGEKGRIEVQGDVKNVEYSIEARLPGRRARLGDVSKTRLKLTDGSVEVSS